MCRERVVARAAGSRLRTWTGVRAGPCCWLVRTVALLIAAVSSGCVALATATAADRSATQQLVGPSVRTFSPELAVNEDGLAVAAWFAGPGPPATAGADTVAGPAHWTGNEVVVSLGSIPHGLGRPLLVARNGTDGQGQVTVAMSGLGIAYVAWLRADDTGSMIATAQAGKLTHLRRLVLPRGAACNASLTAWAAPSTRSPTGPTGTATPSTAPAFTATEHRGGAPSPQSRTRRTHAIYQPPPA